MAQDNTKSCDFSNTNNNDFISTPIAPDTNAESCEINTGLLNLVMKDQFSSLPMKMSHPILIILLICAICKRKKMWIIILLN